MNVIVVEDDRLVLSRMLTLLSRVLPDARATGFLTPAAALSSQECAQADVAILDVNLPGMTGVALAWQLKRVCPHINLIFATAYSEFAMDALNLRASGYLLKPVTEDALRAELANLRNAPPRPAQGRVVVQTFGNFEVFADGRPIPFRRKRSKEILAYLVDRRGAMVSTRELFTMLWEDGQFDRATARKVSTYVLDMIKDLKEAGAGALVSRDRGGLFFCVDAAECDYYRFLRGDPAAINAFTGEYMSAYSWTEFTLGALMDKHG